MPCSRNLENLILQAWDMMDLNTGIFERFATCILPNKSLGLLNANVDLLDPWLLAQDSFDAGEFATQPLETGFNSGV